MLSEQDLAAAEQRFKIALSTREAKRQNEDELLSLIPTLLKAARASKENVPRDRFDPPAGAVAAKKKIPKIIEPLEDPSKTYIAVLIDGNGYKFSDTLVNAEYAGGVEAGEQLSEAIGITLQQARVTSLDLDVRVEMYADFNQYAEGVRAFSTGFNSSFPTYNFVDAGAELRGTYRKIEHAFRLFYNDSNCKQVLLAACHSRYYLNLVQPLVQVHGDKIILVKGDDFEDAFGTLYMRVVQMPSLFPITESAESSEAEDDTIVSSISGLRAESSASSSSMTNSRRSPGQSPGSSPSRGRGRKDTKPARAGAHAVKPTVAPTPMPKDILKSKETPKWIALNKKEHRIDTDAVERPSSAAFNRYWKRSSKPPCRYEHLQGYCHYRSRCKYDHNPVNGETIQCLRWFVQIDPCRAGGACRSSSCLHGHHCTKSGCNGASGKCKFATMEHHIDTTIDNRVPAEENPDVGLESSASSRSPSKASQVTSPQRDGSWEVHDFSLKAGSYANGSVNQPPLADGYFQNDNTNSAARSNDGEEPAKARILTPAFQNSASVDASDLDDDLYDDGHRKAVSGASSRSDGRQRVEESKKPLRTTNDHGETPAKAARQVDDEVAADLMTFDDWGDEEGRIKGISDCQQHHDYVGSTHVV